MESEPDIYVDGFTIGLSPYGVALRFSLSPKAPMPNVPTVGDPIATVRMSLEHAKVMVMLMRKNLKQYELEHLGDQIRVPQGQLQQLRLTEDDW